MNKKINVTQVVRLNKNNNSIIRTLNNLNPLLSKKINLKILECPYDSNGFINKIKNLLWAIKIKDDLVHLTGDINYLAFSIRSPLITSILDLGMPKRYSRLKSFFYNLVWIDFPVIKSKYTITISKKIHDDLTTRLNYYKKKIKIIHIPLEKNYTYNAKKIIEKKIKILHIATSEHNKNTFRMASALKGIKNIHYRIIGVIPNKTLEFLNDNNIKWSIDYNISDSDLLKEYINSDLVVFPSLYEGFGMPIIEAQALGRVVLTSNIEPMVDISGKAAILVNPYKISEIRKGVLSFINENKSNQLLIEQGIINSKRFRLEKIVNQYYNLYLNAIGL
jgi:hypothetical protein